LAGQLWVRDHVVLSGQPPRDAARAPAINVITVRALALLLALFVVLALGAGTAAAADYVPDEVVVGYAATPDLHVAADVQHRMGARPLASKTPEAAVQVLKLPRGETVDQALRKLRGQRGVAYAVPNYIAHADSTVGGWIPDDQGRAHVAGGWQRLQWNFLPGSGVNAPEAWANLRAVGRPGGKGVVVAVLDTGVAYRNWHQFRRSPDFNRTRFVSPYDFVTNNRFPLDREGHGTFVTGTIAESTNNGLGLTGLAYGASIMPVRILKADGSGDAATIAKGIRYAVDHGAKVINLSIEFTPDVTAHEIPDVLSAVRFAVAHHVLVVAAAGNEGVAQVAYPARASGAIAVGATTKDRCLATYSNGGSGLTLVAPGGGNDSRTIADPNCHPGRHLPPIYQMTFFNAANPVHFGFPTNIYGTSMSTPHVAATAALVIASGVIGAHPTPEQIRSRLEQTAQRLGPTQPNSDYGWGLVDAGAATAPGGG
jgi:serine protease